jgi:zinc/manganese transport system substrate-binding protein
MKTWFQGALAALTMFVLAGSPAWATMKVCTSLPDLASVARFVGGDQVDVVSLTDGNQDPHFVPAKPSLMRALRNADLYVAVGLELEVGWLPVVLQGSRNPKIQPGEAGFLDASQGVEVMEKPTGTVNRAEGDVHPMGNPHYYADPKNLEIVADHLADKLAELDPGHAEAYRKNAGDFDLKMEKNLAGWKKRLAPFAGSEVVCYHNNFLYFTHRFGLKDFGFIESRPGIPPSARHLSELADKMKAAKVKVVMYQPYYDAEACRNLAKAAGAEAVLLPTEAGGAPGITDVFTHFEFMVSGLEKAFKK